MRCLCFCVLASSLWAGKPIVVSMGAPLEARYFKISDVPQAIGLSAHVNIEFQNQGRVRLNHNIDNFILEGPQYGGPEIRALVDLYDDDGSFTTRIDPMTRELLVAMRLGTVVIAIREYLLDDAEIHEHFNFQENSLLGAVMYVVGQNLASLAYLIEHQYRHTHLTNNNLILIGYCLFNDCVRLWRRWVFPWERLMQDFVNEAFWIDSLPALDALLDQETDANESDSVQYLWVWSLIEEPQEGFLADLQQLGLIHFYLRKLIKHLDEIIVVQSSNTRTCRFLNGLRMDVNALLGCTGPFFLQQYENFYRQQMVPLFHNVTQRYRQLCEHTNDFNDVEVEPSPILERQLVDLEGSFEQLWRHEPPQNQQEEAASPEIVEAVQEGQPVHADHDSLLDASILRSSVGSRLPLGFLKSI